VQNCRIIMVLLALFCWLVYILEYSEKYGTVCTVGFLILKMEFLFLFGYVNEYQSAF
jgi:hypothetical protein